MMELLEHHLESSVDLVGLFYDREEGPYADNGLEPLLEGLPTVDFAVVLEPTLNQIQAGCVGSIQARVHFQGKRAHSARPWQGRNAIYEALPFLQRLAQVQPRSVFSQGLEFFEVLSATQAFSPGPSNAVPDRFTLNVNQRFAPGKPLPQAEQELRDWIGPGPEVEVLDGAPSGSVRLLGRRPGHLSLATECSCPAFLVVLQAWEAGWKATVDERDAPVLRANVAFQAVRVGAGRHRVDLVYRPRGLRDGLLLGLAGLLGVVLVARRLPA